jgi:hypothetical protein
MKKVVLCLVVMGLFFGGAFSDVQAQGRRTAFSLNLGVKTDLSNEGSFENAWFSLDARLGIAVGRSLEISPEVMAAVDDSLGFDIVYLYPGVMLNYKLGNFFVGAGAVLPLFFYDGETDAYPPAPKVNVGYRAGNLILTAYIFTWTDEDWGFLELNFIGATIGYRF